MLEKTPEDTFDSQESKQMDHPSNKFSLKAHMSRLKLSYFRKIMQRESSNVGKEREEDGQMDSVVMAMNTTFVDQVRERLSWRESTLGLLRSQK